VTKDDHVLFSSETGVVDYAEEDILYKDRLSPSRMLLIDLEKGKIISDDELKSEAAAKKPYAAWLEENMIKLEEKDEQLPEINDLTLRQKIHGYTFEDVQKYIVPLANEGKDPLGSMGNDTPLAVLSDRPQSLFNYFKQLFAQVTNPPIDSIREHVVTSTMTLLGAEGDLLQPNAENARRLLLKTPVLTTAEYEQVVNNSEEHFEVAEISLKFTENLESELNRIKTEAEAAIFGGKTIIVLSDYMDDAKQLTMPVLLAASTIHQYLVRIGLRTKASIIVNSAEVREVHHFVALIGFGVDAIHPYLAYATIDEAIEKGHLS